VPIKYKYDLAGILHKDLFGSDTDFTEKEAAFLGDMKQE